MGFPSQLGKVYVKEQAGSWGTAETSFAASNLISCKPFLPKFVQEALTSEVFKGGWYATSKVGGSRMGSDFTIEHTLQGHSTSTPVADASEHPDALLLRSVLGSGASIGYKAAIESAGHTTSSVKYTNGDLATTWSGMAVLLAVTAATSGRAIAWAKTIDTASTPDALTPWFTLAGAPTNSSPSYGSRTVWTSLTQPTPFTCQVYLGQSDGNAAVQYRDCVVTSAKLTLQSGKQPKIVYGVKAGYWSVTGSWTPASFTDNFPEMPALLGSNGSRVEYSGAPTTFPMVEIELGADMQPAENLGSADSFKKFIMVGRDSKVTITHLVETYASNIGTPGTEAATGLQVDFGTTPGRGGSYFMPTPMVDSISQDEDASGLVVRKTVYTPRPTALETSGANAANSESRICFV